MNTTINSADKKFPNLHGQIIALASVIRRPIVSMYSKKGNPYLRKDLRLRIEPLKKDCDKPLYIMWTSNRFKMKTSGFKTTLCTYLKEQA